MEKNKTIPALTDVVFYFFRMGLGIQHAEAFFYYQELKKWNVKGRSVKNWKSLAFNWVCSFRKAKPLRNISILCE
ncbi:MAG: hypothetical protein E6Q24_15180 [Chitinophagaceae bacterium]|nr:MAG: hypothetical protein E6Q24_15180 [Chitinophagaceae bacterium]